MTRALLLAALLSVGTVQAAPPPKGTEDYEIMADYADWIAQLHVDGVSCCSTADGRPVQARLHGEHWQVRFRAGQLPGAPTEWTDVRDAAVYRGANPVGVPIAWWFGGEIRCFAPPSGI